ncbi:MAG: flagellar basal body rod protein FlgC [Pseudomonadales bacterium]|nr:flagellar basal body rod protein FlgC [Pseudomonadales bacterium]MCP5184723.1 flagellar basal body rod protein FlgC [Pseudomonadales bacterium]
MSLLNIFDIAGSGMSAQSVRLNTTASNLANAESVAPPGEEAYRARYPVFAAELESAAGGHLPLSTEAGDSEGQNVQVLGIVESDKPFNVRYEPDHPYADDNGYVTYPNVNAVEEMANMISASRSFQVNVEMMTTARTLSERILNMGR